MKIRSLTLTAMLLAVSFVLSWLESFVPLTLIFPIPGLKLGLANVAVTAAFLLVGKKCAFAIAVLRPLLSFLIFGNAVSSALSLCGGLLSLAVVSLLLPRTYGKLFSLGGISVISATFHGIGQCLAALVIMQSARVLLYMPLLCAASSVTGLVNGFLMNSVMSVLLPNDTKQCLNKFRNSKKGKPQ